MFWAGFRLPGTVIDFGYGRQKENQEDRVEESRRQEKADEETSEGRCAREETRNQENRTPEVGAQEDIATKGGCRQEIGALEEGDCTKEKQAQSFEC
jgi:hypothetical protein